MPSDCEICPTEIWLSALSSQGRSPATIKSYAGPSASCGLEAEWTTSRRSRSPGFRRWPSPSTWASTTTREVSLCASARCGPGWSWMLAEGLVPSPTSFARMRITVSEEVQTDGHDRGDRRRCWPGPSAAPARLRAVVRARRHRLPPWGACRRGDGRRRPALGRDHASGSPRPTARTVPLSDRAIAALGRWLKYRRCRQGRCGRSATPYSWSTPPCCATPVGRCAARPAAGLRLQLVGAWRL